MDRAAQREQRRPVARNWTFRHSAWAVRRRNWKPKQRRRSGAWANTNSEKIPPPPQWPRPATKRTRHNGPFAAAFRPSCARSRIGRQRREPWASCNAGTPPCCQRRRWETRWARHNSGRRTLNNRQAATLEIGRPKVAPCSVNMRNTECQKGDLRNTLLCFSRLATILAAHGKTVSNGKPVSAGIVLDRGAAGRRARDFHDLATGAFFAGAEHRAHRRQPARGRGIDRLASGSIRMDGFGIADLDFFCRGRVAVDGCNSWLPQVGAIYFGTVAA